MSRTALVASWRSGTKNYRAIQMGDYSASYRDNVIIEREDQDSLGGAAWVVVEHWRAAGIDGEADIRTILFDGLARNK